MCKLACRGRARTRRRRGRRSAGGFSSSAGRAAPRRSARACASAAAGARRTLGTAGPRSRFCSDTVPCRCRSKLAPSAASAICASSWRCPFRLHARHALDPAAQARALRVPDRALNPFFTHGEAAYFLARRDGRVVGRITAQVDYDFNQLPRHRAGGCSASSSSRTTRRSCRRCWTPPSAGCAAHGCDRMVGPMELPAQRRGRGADRGLRARAADPRALEPALLPARCEEAGPDQGDGPVRLGPVDLRPRADEPDPAEDRRARPHQVRDHDPQDGAPPPARARWTSSPRSTTPRGRTTGASCPTPRPTSTPTRSTCSWSTRATGS